MIMLLMLLVLPPEGRTTCRHRSSSRSRVVLQTPLKRMLMTSAVRCASAAADSDLTVVSVAAAGLESVRAQARASGEPGYERIGPSDPRLWISRSCRALHPSS